MHISELIRSSREAEAKSKFNYELLRALISLMSAQEILQNFDFSFTEDYRLRLAKIHQLEVLCEQNPADRNYVKEIVSKLLLEETKVSSKIKAKIIKTLRWLVPLLPVAEQKDIAYKFVQDVNDDKRKIGINLLIKNFVSDDREVLLNCFKQYSDDYALYAITKVEVDLTDIADQLLDYFDEELNHPPNENFVDSKYRQAKIFEKLIDQNFELASKLARKYPIAFVWGAGRSHCIKALPLLQNMIEEYEDDFIILNWIVWGLGKLGARDDLIKLVELFGIDVKLDQKMTSIAR